MLIWVRVSLCDIQSGVETMRVEVEASDLAEGAYFIDKGCEELEAVLRRDPRYSECVVKRQHFGEDLESDPFVVQDFDGKDLAMLDTCVVDALNDSELLSIVDVQIRREEHSNSGPLLLAIVCVIMLGPSAVLFSILTVFLLPVLMGSVISGIAVASSLLVLFSLANYYRGRKNVISKKRNIDLLAAREGVSFLEAIRKLASHSDLCEEEREEYSKRVQYIESELAGVR